MCGLVGVFGKDLGKNELDFFKQALAVDFLRGKHSTGFAKVGSANDSVDVVKATLSGPDFIENYKPAVDKLGHIGMSRALLGHNRYATSGSTTAANAHPFSHGDIVFMHNGTITNIRDFDAKYGRVDSDIIGEEIAYNSVEDIIPKIDGSFCFIWYDKVAGTVNMIRNKERPLFIAEHRFKKGNELGNSYLYASEEGMLEWLADRNGVWISNVRELPVGELYTFPISEALMTPSTRKVPLYEKKYLPVHTTTYHHHTRNGSLNSGTANDSTRTVVTLHVPNSGKVAGREVVLSPECLQEMKKHNLQPGQVVNFYSLSYKPYSAAGLENTGSLTGWMANGVNMAVRANSLRKEVWKSKHFTNGMYSGKIIGTYRDADGMGFLVEDVIFMYKIKSKKIKDEISNLEEEEEVDEYSEQFLDALPDTIYTEDFDMDKSKFTRLIEQGCCDCGDPLPYNPKKVHLMVMDAFMCTPCKEGWLANFPSSNSH